MMQTVHETVSLGNAVQATYVDTVNMPWMYRASYGTYQGDPTAQNAFVLGGLGSYAHRNPRWRDAMQAGYRAGRRDRVEQSGVHGGGMLTNCAQRGRDFRRGARILGMGDATAPPARMSIPVRLLIAGVLGGGVYLATDSKQAAALAAGAGLFLTHTL